MNKKLLWLLTLLLLAAGTFAEAQQPKKSPRIGVIFPVFQSAASPFMEAFREGLHDRGYIEGKNIVVEYRYAEGKEDRLPALAAELVRLNMDIIVVGGGNATLAAKNATKTIPIVMGVASDPVGAGLVASLALPGGNITGSTLINSDLSGKRLELLKEAIPRLSQVAVLVYRDNPAATLMLKETETAGQSLGLQLQILEVRNIDELENAFGVVKKGHSEAINVLSSAFFGGERKKIVELASRTRLPAMYFDKQFVESGGLMSYGANVADLFRRAANYVDKILKGAKPADLPVEQPTKFELMINLKAAKQIGLTIPPNVLARADKVVK
jgi:putative tryptophan/tyrosine transport system substrate-binding protein